MLDDLKTVLYVLYGREETKPMSLKDAVRDLASKTTELCCLSQDPSDRHHTKSFCKPQWSTSQPLGPLANGC